MSTAAISPTQTNWREEWFEFEDATYLNLAGESPMPKVALRAVQAAIADKKHPHHRSDSVFFEIPERVRANIARLIGAKSEEVAVTTGASTGAVAAAHALDWKPGDEVITAAREFPLQYTTWRPMEQRAGIKLRIVEPRDRFLSGDDLISAMTSKTKLISVSMVRFEDAVRLDAKKLAAACHAQGALLLLDVSQNCGAIPLDVRELGADFLVCAGYKWLLGPYGCGFFWIRHELLRQVRPDAFSWMAVPGAHDFAKLNFADPQPENSAKRWDAAEWASHFNFNLVAFDASLEFLLRVGAETVETHNRRLIEFMYERLPKDRCVPASPLDSARRGPYGCFAARSKEKTAELYNKLRKENVIVSLREGNIRVSPHLYNTERDIDRLISVITA